MVWLRKPMKLVVGTWDGEHKELELRVERVTRETKPVAGSEA